MSKKYKGKSCVYCAERLSETADHVVAREFFPENLRNDLPKAPACKPCNQAKSTLEHTFTALLPFGSAHKASARVLRERVKGRLAKNPRLTRSLQSGLRPIIVPQESGWVSSISLPFQGDEFVCLCEYVIRGLVWHEYIHVVPADYYVEAVPVSDVGLRFFDALLQKSPDHRRSAEFAGGALRYRCTRNSVDPGFTVWHIQLYDQLGIAGDDGAGGFIRLHICGVTGPAEVREIMDEFKGLGQPEQPGR